MRPCFRFNKWINNQISCMNEKNKCLTKSQSSLSVMCGGSLDRAVLSVSLFRQVQRSPCQCYHLFITEGNPTAEPRLYVLSSCTVSTLVSADQTIPPSLLPAWFFLPPGGIQTRLCSTHKELHVVHGHHPVCFSLRAMAFAG